MSDRAYEIREELVHVALDLLDDFDMLAEKARRWDALTSPETIEKAAKALFSLMQRGKPWEDDPPGKLDHYRKLAQFVLQAVAGVEEGTNE